MNPSGSAERNTTIWKVTADETTCPIMAGKMKTGADNDDTYNENSNPLRDLSMTEILKLAEARGRVAGMNERSAVNPSRKRMVLSDDITRSQAMRNTPITNRKHHGLINTKDELDNNEEFFENLSKKMIMEQFMPCDRTDRLRKTRICPWNKENLKVSNKNERLKSSRTNRKTKSIPSTTGLLAKRFSLRQNDDNSPARAKIQSQCESLQIQQQDGTCPRHESVLNLSQKGMNIKEFDSCSTDSDSSLAATISVHERFHEIQAVDDCTQETLKLERNRPIDRNDGHLINEISPSHHDAERYSKNFWISPCLPTIGKEHEPSMIIKPLCAAIHMEFDTTLQLTPPLSTESIDCEACNFAERKSDDSLNNDSN